jgi:hypothetical protein
MTEYMTIEAQAYTPSRRKIRFKETSVQRGNTVKETSVKGGNTVKENSSKIINKGKIFINQFKL